MKKLLYTLSLIMLGTLAQAQVKIGNNPGTINSNAVLEVESTNKGMIIPRVALASATDVTTIPAPLIGMIVYNTSTTLTDLSSGLVFWNGTSSQWQAVQVQTSNNTLTSRVLQSAITTTTTEQDMDFGTNFTLPSDGAYAFSFRLYGDIITSSSTIAYIRVYINNVVQDAAEMQVVEGPTNGTYSVTLGGSGKAGDKIRITLSHYTNYSAWKFNSSAGATAGQAAKTSLIYWKL